MSRFADFVRIFGNDAIIEIILSGIFRSLFAKGIRWAAGGRYSRMQNQHTECELTLEEDSEERDSMRNL